MPMFWKLWFCIGLSDAEVIWSWQVGQNLFSFRPQGEMIHHFFPGGWAMRRHHPLSLDMARLYQITVVLASSSPHPTLGRVSLGDDSSCRYQKGGPKKANSDQYSCSSSINNWTANSVFSFFDLLLSSGPGWVTATEVCSFQGWGTF